MIIRKLVPALMLLCSPLVMKAQDFQTLLNKGKAEFKKEYELQNYAVAADYLEKALVLQPENTEARYFLGYAYSRMNSDDASGIIKMSKEITVKTSLQFETIIKLSPKYQGEMIVLDPYSKISSEWGSLALYYLYHNKKDSALWAFGEGKARGGFTKYMLDVNKKILDACSHNAILVSSGDNFTFPFYYLQYVENYRTDISFFDINLLNTEWYSTFLEKNKIVSFGMALENHPPAEYMRWTDSLITVKDFSWVMSPVVYNSYIFRNDILLLKMLVNNEFKRDVFFTKTFNEDNRIGLGAYLKSYGIVDKLNHNNETGLSADKLREAFAGVLSLSSKINMNSQDELWMLNVFRTILLMSVNDYVDKGDMPNARLLMNIHDKYADVNTIDYNTENDKKYYDYVIEKLK